MKRLIYIGIIFTISVRCTSYNETIHETLEIFILNGTDNTFNITLFPKKELLAAGSSLYSMCEGCSGYKSTKFELLPKNQRFLFYTDSLNTKPYKLASIAFDSIHISLINNDKVTIKFAHEDARGYSENIFSEYSTWDFVIAEDNWQMQFNRNALKFYRYTFAIFENKIILTI